MYEAIHMPMWLTPVLYSAVVYADLLVSLPREIKYIWRAKWSLLKVLYICLRWYCTFYSSFLLWMLYGPWTTSSCQPAYHMVPFLGMFEVGWVCLNVEVLRLYEASSMFSPTAS